MTSSQGRPSSIDVAAPPLGLFAPAVELHGRRGAAQRVVLGRHAPARQPIPRASGRDRPACARLRGRAGRRRPHARAAGQLRAGACRSAGGRRDRSDAAAVRHRRPARRPWPRYRRFQGRQRDRRRAQGRPSLLFRRLPAGADARPDDRGHRARRGGISRKGHRAASRGRRKALRDRQLPGRLGGHDAGRAFGPSCSARSSSPARRCPTGPACAANIRCATAAACSAAAG